MRFIVCLLVCGMVLLRIPPAGAQAAAAGIPEAAGPPVALDATDWHYLTLALGGLKMSPHDLAFKKDLVDSELVLLKARGFLGQPLVLPGYGQRVMTELQAALSLEALAGFARAQIEIPAPPAMPALPAAALDPVFLAKLPPAVARSVQAIYQAAVLAAPLLQRALPADKRGALAAYALDALDLDHDRAELDSWDKLGLDTSPARSLLRRAEDLDLQDTEVADVLLAASDQFDRRTLFAACQYLTHAVDAAIADLQTNKFTGEFEVACETPLGKIICGGAGRNVYRDEAFLIIDTGGDDRYENSAGGANGLVGRPISIVIDCGGNDEYVSGRSFSQGVGLFGIGILADLGGDDLFRAKHLSQGAGFFGTGLLMTGRGRQHFEADMVCQGAGLFGAGILWQRGGDTDYRAHQMAQGFGGVSGCGLLLDADGNDHYYAGGKTACGWLPGHFFSLSQGFGYGMRPFAGGGVGILADLSGDDRYEADVYGQGASYWYAVGLLLDAAGNDSYQAYQYCQGAGIHLSSGALIDWGGDDRYVAHAICQGGAHDYSVGLLVDRAGNDHYTGDTTAQGSAINNSFALLLDRAGNDVYEARDPKQSLDAGHDGGRREYGSVALMLDLGGADTYAQGQTNNTVWIKPLYGAGVDIEARTERFSWQSGSGGRAGWPSPPSQWRQQQSDGGRNSTNDGRASAGWASPPYRGNCLVAAQRRDLRSADVRGLETGAQHDAEVRGRETDAQRAGVRLYRMPRVDVNQPIERLLRRALRDGDTEPHRRDAETAWADLQARGAEALPYLVTRVDSPNVMVRVKIEDLIDHMGSNAVPALITGIDTAANEERARLCCYFLARFDWATNAIPHLLPLLAHDKIRSVCLYTLGHLRARQAFLPAVAALKDRQELVRLRAAQALGRIGDPRAIPALIATLADEFWTVRYAAADALVALGQASAGPLRRAFDGAAPRAKPHIIEALAKLGDRRALPLVRRGFPDQPALVRDAVVRQLEAEIAPGTDRPGTAKTP